MISYRDYQLPQSTIDYLKQKNARQSIAKYILEHGEEPSDINQFFVVSPAQIEQYKRISYAKLLTSGKDPESQEDEQGELVTRSFGISAVDDNILGANGEILRAGNDNYQYNYWRIIVISHLRTDYSTLVSSANLYAIGDFTSLENASIVLDTRYHYTFLIYLRKTNFIYEGMLTYNVISSIHSYDSIFANLPDNVFKYENEINGGSFSGILYSYNNPFDDNHEIFGTQNLDKEYIGTVLKYDPLLQTSISGNVYTLNPQLICTFNNFTKDSGTLSIELEENNSTTTYLNSLGIYSIKFWYNNNIIETNGKGTILNQTETSFDYVFAKQELIQSYDIGSISRMSFNVSLLGTANFVQSNSSIMTNIPFTVSVSKEGYLSNTTGKILFSLLRNSSVTTSVTVPNLGTTTEPGIDIGIVDD